MGAMRVVALLLLCSIAASSAQQVIRLGFLLPYPDGDTAVPKRLADEWISAVRVALEVLGPVYKQQFIIEPLVQNSACDRKEAEEAANRLVAASVAGVVGPACSEAVLGANAVFQANQIPFVTFAATADEFGGKSFDTLFRTVFSHRHQVAAIGSVIRFFRFYKVRIFYTDETYGRGLSADLQKLLLAARPPLTPAMVKVAYPASNDPADYEQYFTDRTPAEQSISIFATLPVAAGNLWKAAARLNLTQYPWWYLGTDGAMAFDLVGEGDNLTSLGKAIQGEIAIGPYRGDYNPSSSPFLPFIDFWKLQSHESYPGLLTLDVNPRIVKPRLYVAHLIDAVTAFFHAFDSLQQAGSDINAYNVLQCFRNVPQNCVRFKGATGTVAFNASTGERALSAQIPQYSFYNLIGYAWHEKSRWRLNSEEVSPNLDQIVRPGPLPSNWKDAIVKVAPAAIIPADLNAAQAPLADNFSNFAPPPGNLMQLNEDNAPPGGGLIVVPGPPPPVTVSNTKNSEGSASGGGSSTPVGAIVALVFVCIAVVAVAGGVGYYYFRRHKREDQLNQFVRML